MNKEKNEIKIKKKENKGKKKKVFLIVLGVFLFLAAIVGVDIVKSSKIRKEKVGAMEVQRQIMIDSWKEEGLNDEEIEAKLEEMSVGRMDGEGRGEKGSDPLFMIRRTIMGGGRGDGSGRGMPR